MIAKSRNFTTTTGVLAYSLTPKSASPKGVRGLEKYGQNVFFYLQRKGL
jgi:hypothetical protein